MLVKISSKCCCFKVPALKILHGVDYFFKSMTHQYFPVPESLSSIIISTLFFKPHKHLFGGWTLLCWCICTTSMGLFRSV